MEIGQKIKKLRKEKGMSQEDVAMLINMHRANYSKIESGQREISVTALNTLANYFDITLDELVNGEPELPKEIKIEDKSLLEKVKMLQELEDEDKNMVVRMIETLLTKNKFKDFFNKNIAAL